MKRRSHLVMLFVFFLATFAARSGQALIRNVPSVLTAPVVFYDEGGNVLPDGTYGVTVTLSDADGSTLYQEEQSVSVVNGAAELVIGEGYAPGSNYTQSAGGLSLDLFQGEGEVAVEIAVDGQVMAQTTAILGAQPYAFVSEYAISVAADAVTSSAIADGAIVAEDLDAGLLSELRSGVVLEDGGTSAASVESLETHEALTAGVHGVAAGSAIVGTAETQTLSNKTLDGTNQISGAAITSGTVAEERIDNNIARLSQLRFNNIEGSVTDSQIPAEITRDTELNFENLAGRATLDQVPDELATDAEVLSSYLSRDGGTLSGNLSLRESDLEITPGYLIDGVDVSEMGASVTTHETRLDEIESHAYVTWVEVASGTWPLSACGTQNSVALDETDVAASAAGEITQSHYWVRVSLSKSANAASSSVAIEWQHRVVYDGTQYRHEIVLREVGSGSTNCSYHSVNYTIYRSTLN